MTLPRLPVATAFLLLLGPLLPQPAYGNTFLRYLANAGAATAIVQTQDGGYAVAGRNYLVRFDAEGGTVFHKTYGTFSRRINGLVHTSDGGFAFAATDGVINTSVGQTFTVSKLDPAGNIEWERKLGGSGFEAGTSITEVFDASGNPNGLAVAGVTVSFDAGGGDTWVVRLDPFGGILWEKTYGTASSHIEDARAIVQTSDGGFAVVSAFGSRSWLLRLDADGQLLWNRVYARGGSRTSIESVIQTRDGGFAIAGRIGPPTGERIFDEWVTKVDPLGAVEWSVAYGGSQSEDGGIFRSGMPDIVEADDGYVVAGFTASFGAGGTDAMLTKLDADGNVVWSKTYGGTRSDNASSLVRTFDGGYAVAGFTSSFGTFNDLLLVKTDVNGNVHECLPVADNTDLLTVTPIAGLTASTVGIAGVPSSTPVGTFPSAVGSASVPNLQRCPVPPDTTAPLTTIALTGIEGNNGWFRSDVIVTLTAADGPDGSGVASTEYRVNGGAWAAYTSPFTMAAEGMRTIEYRSADRVGNVEAIQSHVVEIDKTPPAVSCGASPESLWPPTRQLVPVDTAVSVTDAVSGTAGFVLNSTASSEPDGGAGHGDVPDDIQAFELGAPDTNGLLRAERAAGGGGRVYLLTYEGADVAGNTAACTAIVSVPHDLRR